MKTKCSLLVPMLLALLAAAPMNAQNACFAPQVTYGTNPAPVGSTVGDFNNDGFADIAVTNQTGTVSILLGVGNGTFGVASNFAAGTQPYGIATTDLNNDNKLDLVVTNMVNIGSFYSFLGNGNGTFAPGVNFSTGSQTKKIAVGDINNDGNMDAAVINTSSLTVQIFLGTGMGTFAGAINYTVPNYPSDLIIADINNDGNKDVVTSNVTVGAIAVLLGNGTGAFGAYTPYPAGPSPWGIAAADFNGDGLLDIATANNTGDNFSVLLNTGAGTFGAATQLPLGSGAFPRDIDVGDFNNDGKWDVVAMNAGFNNVAVMLGNGQGGFTAGNTFTVGSSGNHVTIGNFNADNKNDIVSCNQGSANVSILLNNAPTVTLNLPSDTICQNNGSIVLSGGSPMGGTFSGTGVNGGIFDPSVSGVGNFMIQYSYTDVNGCNGNAFQSIHVDLCLGTESTLLEESFQVFPNPGTGIYTLQFPALTDGAIYITDIHGKCIYSANALTSEIDLSSANKGVYFLKIVLNNETVTKRLIKY